jgi:mono/diheme cytochrome c family protein
MEKRLNTNTQRCAQGVSKVIIAALLLLVSVNGAYGQNTDGVVDGVVDGVGVEGGVPGVATTSLSEAQVRGQALFEEHCEGCHGPQGVGAASAPQLQGIVRAYGAHVVRTGRDEMPEHEGAMPAFSVGKLSDEGLDDIWAFVEAAPRPTDGEGLFKRYCANCHGAEGTGGRTARDAAHVSEKGAAKVLRWVRKGHGGASYEDRRQYMPAWDAAGISDDEVTKMTEYLLAFSKKGKEKK